jgi:hypothetical protein
MSKSKPNEYWLGKVKLWMILHGGWEKVRGVDLCSLCRYNIGPLTSSWGVVHYRCKRKDEMRGRLGAKRDFTSIKFNPNINAGDIETDYFCVEWIKDV